MVARAVAFSWLLFGCTSPLTEARTSFEEARYPDAVEQYARLGAGVPGLSPRELFEYSLYRGLSHLALGDAANAERWLTVCKRLADASPEHASLPEVNRLLSARRAMGHASGD
ncbi:MAG: hypothetical protein K0R38_4350 [Polyangiaceae bacterium]|jgi:hypothetical protein|nr:hypothetical protein [Polyangiaceae bacterium]